MPDPRAKKQAIRGGTPVTVTIDGIDYRGVVSRCERPADKCASRRGRRTFVVRLEGLGERRVSAAQIENLR